ncbi:S9 family peptidase [bacterium]|nr:S9 family peptidase [bacterium]
MNRFIKIITFSALLIFASLSVNAQKRAMQISDLWKFNRIGALSLSPDGERIAYTIIRYTGRNLKKESDIFLVNKDGGQPKQLTTSPGFDGNPRWSPDGSLLAFLSDRSGERQIFAIPLDGGEARQIRTVKGGIEDFVWSPDGRYFAFIPFNKYARKENELSVTVYQNSYFNKRLPDNRIMIMSSTGGKPWNLIPSSSKVAPVLSPDFRNFDFSADGTRFAFIGCIDTVKSSSYGTDVFIALSTGRKMWRITVSPGKKSQPRFSPDGRYLCYKAIPRSKGCSGQHDLMLFDRRTGRNTNITVDFNLDVEEAVWGSSSDKIFFTASDQGRKVVFSIDVKKKKVKGLIHEGCNFDLSVSHNDNYIFMRRSTFSMPAEIFRTNENGDKPFELTFTNQILLDSIKMNNAEDFWYRSFDSKTIHGFLIKPPFFDVHKKYPAIFLIQEDPHHGWYDMFRYFWNANLFAAEGMVVIMANLRGSKGYGIEFSTSLNGDWTGAAYKDILSGLDHILKKYSFIDERNIFAAGSFYGGFLSDWISLHSDRFSAVVSHASITNMLSLYGTGSAEFFVSEFGQAPYGNFRKYDKISPVRSRPEARVPCLITHGAMDDKINLGQSIEFFSALQYFNIPSRIIIFNKEGHVLTNPEDIKLWWNYVLEWIKEFTTE